MYSKYILLFIVIQFVILTILIFMLDKELAAAKERQEIELAAQRATLQEQRTHIDILDTALTNAQGNVVRLEEEVIFCLFFNKLFHISYFIFISFFFILIFFTVSKETSICREGRPTSTSFVFSSSI